MLQDTSTRESAEIVTVILRSVLVGIASVVGAIFIGIPVVFIALLAYQRTQDFGSG